MPPKNASKGGSAKKKKEAVNLFPTTAVLNYQDPVKDPQPEDMRNGEFDATQLYFNPAQQRGECSMTLAFRCTARIAAGDTITIRLGGFKGGQATVFALESRPNDDFDKLLAEMHEKNRKKQTSLELRFQAYYSGENPPKGVPPQCIILRCRHAVEENMKVVVGIPESAHICLPDKLIANSAKIKIEGIVRHADGGKIPKAPFQATGEVRKRPIEVDIAELEELIDFYGGGQRKLRKKSTAAEPILGEDGQPIVPEGGEAAANAELLNEEDDEDFLDDGAQQDTVDMEIVEEITQPEADLVIENAPHRCQLQMGLRWITETHVFHSYESSCQFVVQSLNESAARVKNSAGELYLHKEIAKNLDVKLSQILVLEDILNTIHGAYYPGHSRAAVMVMRLYTMEAHDLVHLLNVSKPPCIYREIHSAVRSKNADLLNKWAYFILTLSTTIMNLREYTHARDVTPPSLFVGLKDLPHDELTRISKLKRGDFYMTTNFTNCVMDVDIQHEDFSPPDTGVLFEFRGVLNGVEIGDCSQYPNDREWLLPMFSSFLVVGVENYADKNHMIKVILEFRGSFGGLSDMGLPAAATEDRNRFKMAVSISGVGGISENLRKMAQTTALTTKCIYATLRLRECRARQPQHLLHAKYLAQYADTMRASKASQTIEEGYVKWYYCSSEGTNANPDAANQPQRWEVLAPKFSVPTEMYFLKRTRTMKVFTQEQPALTVDFTNAKIDFGKGLQSIRRDVGKSQSYPFDDY